MNSSETKLEKSCSICGLEKNINMFVIGRNLCKICRNEKTRNDYYKLVSTDIKEQKCNVCELVKTIDNYHKGRKICSLCTSITRRDKYSSDETYRARVIKESIKYRKDRGWPETSAHMFKTKIRSNIRRCLTNKTKRTMEYIGCTSEEYIKWLFYEENDYSIDNHGTLWHIDHVIPLSKFDLNNAEELLIATNWRNTAPLSCTNNLKKGNKIDYKQIEQHFIKLSDYHTKNNIDLPQVFIDIFAKHLDDGKPLKPSLPLTSGNLCEEHD